MFSQSVANDYVVFEAEDYSHINSVLLSSPYWAGTADATASGGSALSTQAGVSGAVGNADLEPNRTQYFIKAAVTGNYTVYVRAKNTSNNQNSGFRVSNSFNSIGGQGVKVDNTGSYLWVKAGSTIAMTAGQTGFISTSPENNGVWIDKIVLAVNASLSSTQLDNLASQAIECLTLPGVLSLTSNADTLTVIAPYNSFQSFIRPTQTNYYSVSGNSVVSLQCYETPCSPQVVFGYARVSCYNGIVTPSNPIKVSFNWYSPNGSLFSGNEVSGDYVRVRALFDNGAIVTLPSISGDEIASSANDDKFIQYTGSITNLPSVSGNLPTTARVEITLIGGVGNNKSDYFWVDNVTFQLDNPSLAADADFIINDLLDPDITFGNLSGPSCTPNPASPFCDLGNGFKVYYDWVLGDGNTYSGVLSTLPHTYGTDGSYNVSLTVTVKSNVPGCENSSMMAKSLTVENALPVTLSAFGARPEKQDVHLSWETANELNNDYFEVEHSQDGITFRPLATIKGAGNSQAPLRYGWIHAGAPAGVNYYRLKQVDFGGAFEYSDVVSVRMAGRGEIRLFPNPAREFVQVMSSEEEPLSYFIFDALGRLLRKGTVDPQGRIDLSALSAGIYQARIETVSGVLLTMERIVRSER